MNYRLLDEFQKLFDGKQYKHRDSSLGDWVAHHLYEDLFRIAKSTLLCDRIAKREHVLNVANKRKGISARRGDGTFGEGIPGIVAIVEPGFEVARGEIANVEIGAEVIGLDDYPAVVKPILEARHEDWKKFQASLCALGRKKNALGPSSRRLTTEASGFSRDRHSFKLKSVGGGR